MNTKPWYQSKTLWLNLLVMALSLADLLSHYIALPAGTWGIIIGVLNIFLRTISGQSLTMQTRQPLEAGDGDSVLPGQGYQPSGPPEGNIDPSDPPRGGSAMP